MKGYRLSQAIETWYFPHGQLWQTVTKIVQGFRSKKILLRTEVVVIHLYQNAGKKKYLLKMPSWPVKPKLGEDSGMRRELPLLVASVFSIRLSLSTIIYSTGRRTKLAL